MHFVRGVVLFARVGWAAVAAAVAVEIGGGVAVGGGGIRDCHWGICLGLHLSAVPDETPMLSISQLSVTSLLRNE